MNISAASWIFLGIICGFLPLAAVLSARKARRQRAALAPSRRQYLLSTFYIQGMMLVLALAAAKADYIRLFPRPRLGPFNLLVFISFLVPAVGTLPLRWRWNTEPEKRRKMWIVPNRIGDFWWWTLVSLTAGIVEEIAYRGVLFTVWERLLRSRWSAVAVCAGAFAVAHAIQGWRTVAVIVLLAICNHVIVFATGDLYTAMAVHVVYDLLAGFILMRLAQRDGTLPLRTVAEAEPQAHP
jgi:membrane protease YdiL (CAAX protease family)